MAVVYSAREASYAFKVGAYSSGELRIVRLSGREGVSELFHFELDLASEDREIKFEDVIGKPALVGIYGLGEERWIHGMVRTFEHSGEGMRFTHYRAEIVPAIWRLVNRYRSRIFQNLSVRDIIEKVLKEAGLASDQFRFALQKQYKAREYCVQYRETDLNFLSRLMEEEGIFYFFEHTKERHVLVMGDSPTAHVLIEKPETVDFHEVTGTEPTEEHIYEYRYAQEVRPGAVMLRDFNFKKPKMNLQRDSKGKQDTELEVYDYPGEYEEPGVGQERAKVRLQELQATRQLGTGKSTCRRLLPGYRFKLDKHPQADFNKEYLLLRVVHEGTQLQALEEAAGLGSEGSYYENRFECIPYDVPYRPPRRTPRPVVCGIQTAIVVGPPGEEIYTDECGRVKVQFHWDREGEYNEKSSCWIRVSQGWAGGNYGMMFLPRVGHEVIVDFLEGDPDRPLIVGRVYNGDERPPYKLPDEKTKSTIKSSSSKGHEGSNEIRFEDAKGEEHLFIHAEKDLEIRAKGARKESIEGDRHLTVGGEKRELIEKKKQVHVKDAQVVWIEKDSNLTVGGNLVEEVQKNHAEVISQEYNLQAKTIIVEAGQELMIKAPGGFIKIDAKGIIIQGKLVKINSGGAPSISSAAGLACVAPQDPIAAIKAVYGKDTTYTQAPPPLPAPPPPGKTEKKTHWIEYCFFDSAKKPVSGLPYKFTDTTKKVEKGKLAKGQKLRRDGIPAGICDVQLGMIEAVWSKTEASPDEEVEMIADVSGFDSGTAATIEIYKLYKEAAGEAIQKVSAVAQANKVKSKWRYKYRKEDEGTKPQFVFRVKIGELWTASSNILEIRDSIEIDVKDKEGHLIADMEYTMVLPDGEKRFGKTDAQGHISEKNLAIGDCKVTLGKYMDPQSTPLALAEPYKLYIVKQGDWLAKIAREHGINDWKQIWDAERNRDLKEKRKDPNVLYPGDELWIPEPEVKILPTEGKKPGTKVIEVERPEKELLRLRFLDSEDRPRANVACQISFGVEPSAKSTDGNGILEVEVPPEATRCTVKMGYLIYECDIGHLDPIDTISGIQGRLNNLGFNCGKVDGILGPKTRAAVRAFQEKYQLKADCIPGSETQAKLEEVYGC